MSTTTVEKTETPQVNPEEAVKLLHALQNQIFAFWYRARYRPTHAVIVALSIEDARDKAEKYCEKFNLRFISVHPYFLDLNKKPSEGRKLAGEE